MNMLYSFISKRIFFFAFFLILIYYSDVQYINQYNIESLVKWFLNQFFFLIRSEYESNMQGMRWARRGVPFWRIHMRRMQGECIRQTNNNQKQQTQREHVDDDNSKWIRSSLRPEIEGIAHKYTHTHTRAVQHFDIVYNERELHFSCEYIVLINIFLFGVWALERAREKSARSYSVVIINKMFWIWDVIHWALPGVRVVRLWFYAM